MTKKGKPSYRRQVEHIERVSKAEARVRELEQKLAEMTRDRDLWRDEHNGDCPNKAMVETLEQQLKEARDALTESRKVRF